jgi:hypothetical protein
MRKILTSAMAGVLAAGAVLATAAPAAADGRHRYYGHRHHRGGGDDEVAAAILGGVAGLALGAALSSGNRSRGYYESGYYDRAPRYRYNPRYDSYYGDGYRGGYRTCITRDRVYDPYIGRRVTIERRYAC